MLESQLENNTMEQTRGDPAFSSNSRNAVSNVLQYLLCAFCFYFTKYHLRSYKVASIIFRVIKRQK